MLKGVCISPLKHFFSQHLQTQLTNSARVLTGQVHTVKKKNINRYLYIFVDSNSSIHCYFVGQFLVQQRRLNEVCFLTVTCKTMSSVKKAYWALVNDKRRSVFCGKNVNLFVLMTVCEGKI